jgi:DNA-binding SARP family transcriptional activator
VNLEVLLVTSSFSPVPRDVRWATDVQIRCFGRFELSRQGATLQRWRRRSAERLLKFLLIRGRPVHRDVVLDALWPDIPTTLSIRGLRVALHTLRRAIAQLAPESEPVELVRAAGDTYELDTRQVWIDRDAFNRHYSAGLRFENLHQNHAAAREYSAAESLYRDDFLVEDVAEDWAVFPREELKDEYLMLLSKLAQLNLAAMDLDGCIRRSQALIAKEPCCEGAYLQLMQCYARLGNPGTALHWYQICERTLRHELKVSPSDATRRLHHEILQASASARRSVGILEFTL